MIVILNVQGITSHSTSFNENKTEVIVSTALLARIEYLEVEKLLTKETTQFKNIKREPLSVKCIANDEKMIKLMKLTFKRTKVDANSGTSYGDTAK